MRVNKKERKGGKRRGRKLQDSRDVKNKIRKELEEIQWIEDKQSESEKRRKRRTSEKKEVKENRDLHSRVASTGTKFEKTSKRKELSVQEMVGEFGELNAKTIRQEPLR